MYGYNVKSKPLQIKLTDRLSLMEFCDIIFESLNIEQCKF
jgi:hypothetical protein